MIAAHVVLVFLPLLAAVAGHIHLTTENRLERLLAFLLAFLVHRLAVVGEFLNSEHVSMIGYSHTFHPVGNSLVDKPLDARLTVEYRVICMYVEMNEVLHVSLI